jgi:hypothetical protein
MSHDSENDRWMTVMMDPSTSKLSAGDRAALKRVFLEVQELRARVIDLERRTLNGAIAEVKRAAVAEARRNSRLPLDEELDSGPFAGLPSEQRAT